MWNILQKLIIQDSIDFNMYDKYIKYINHSSVNGNSCLHFAVISNNADKIVPFLLKKGANINIINNYGQNCLHWACKQGNLNIIKLLINSGANIHVLDNHGYSILHWAIEYDNDNVLYYLLSLKLQKNNKVPKTIFDIAKNNQSTKCLKMLKRRPSFVTQVSYKISKDNRN